MLLESFAFSNVMLALGAATDSRSGFVGEDSDRPRPGGEPYGLLRIA